MTQILDMARRAFRAGLCPLPVAEDGTKRPDVPTWRAFQTRRPTQAEMHAWDFNRRSGIGVIAGVVSGCRECWDFDCPDTFETFVTAAHACGLGDVVARIRAGYEDDTPAGGRRWIVGYPESVTWKDRTLARRPGREGEPPIKTLIELPTFAILAPTNGRVHPSGRAYVRRSGDVDMIATYTQDERDALIALARAFDQMPRPTPREPAARPTTETRPGDDFNARASWSSILEPAGWRQVHARGEEAYWCRPGKPFGVSATTNYAGSDLLYVFTSSSTFEPDTSYTKFGAYTVLHHGGDYAHAAGTLAAEGYGHPLMAVANPPLVPATPYTLADVETVFAQWIRDPDPIPTRAVLASYVATHLAGDPVWLMLVGGSGCGKTERLIPLSGMADVVLESSITGPAALLSGTSRKERTKDATGGLLRKFPAGGGVLVLKDFTSILDMHRDARAEVLAALREVYDGRWDRSVGVDGGKTLTWIGHLGLIAGCTTAIDSAHAVMSVMGTRFLLVRLRGDQQLAGSAFDHVGDESPMRDELRVAVRGLLEHLPGTAYDKAEIRAPIIALASYVALARSPVDRDQRSEIRLVLDAEAPTRIVKMLTQLWRASGLLGLDKVQAWEMVHRVGLDSIPKLRRAVLDYLAGSVTSLSTTQVAEAVEHPTQTTRRALEDLAAHRVIIRIASGSGKADRWELAAQSRDWLEQTFPVLSVDTAPEGPTVPVLSVHTDSAPHLLDPLNKYKTTITDKTGKVDLATNDPLPAWVTDAAEPDHSDPIGAHDEETP